MKIDLNEMSGSLIILIRGRTQVVPVPNGAGKQTSFAPEQILTGKLRSTETLFDGQGSKPFVRGSFMDSMGLKLDASD